jgi:hypothetical protein
MPRIATIWPHPTIAQSVKGCDTRAKKGELRLPSILFGLPRATPTGIAVSEMATVPPDADPVTWLPLGNVRLHRIDNSDNFASGTRG